MTEPPRLRTVADTLFRVLSSGIFLTAGVKHLVSPDAIGRRLEAAPFGHLATALAPSHLLVILAGVALLAGGAALLVGWRTRAAAALLILVLIPITVTVQVGAEELGPLFKNVAILGGLIHFAVAGASGVSVDGALAQRRAR